MYSKLRLYLNGALSYQEACSVFFQLCPNKTLAGNLCRREESNYTREKLEYEINKLLLSVPAESDQPESPASASNHQPVRLPNSLSKSGSTILEQVLASRKEMYLERGHLHGRLHEAETDEQRLSIAREIIAIQPKINALNRDLRLLEQNEIPVTYIRNNTDGSKQLRVRNLKMYIARYEKKLNGTNDLERRKKYEELISQYKMELNQLINGN